MLLCFAGSWADSWISQTDLPNAIPYTYLHAYSSTHGDSEVAAVMPLSWHSSYMCINELSPQRGCQDHTPDSQGLGPDLTHTHVDSTTATYTQFTQATIGHHLGSQANGRCCQFPMIKCQPDTVWWYVLHLFTPHHTSLPYPAELGELEDSQIEILSLGGVGQSGAGRRG